MNVEAPAAASATTSTPRPFDPGLAEPTGAESEGFYRASSWRLMWWKFRRHKVAVASALILLAFYLAVPFVEVIAPYNQTKRHGDFLYAPPQRVHLFHEGSFVGPFVYPYKFTFNLETFRRDYVVDRTKPQPIRFFCRGDAYEFWGVVHADFHLFCPPEDGTLFLARHRPARARPVLAHHLRGPDLADDRHRRHRRVVHARALLRRLAGYHRRLGRPRHPAA